LADHFRQFQLLIKAAIILPYAKEPCKDLVAFIRSTAKSYWNRLIRGLNRAPEAVGQAIGEPRQTVGGLKAVFLRFLRPITEDRLVLCATRWYNR
jgi:hypothetical protein